jgi:hypothetical protein
MVEVPYFVFLILFVIIFYFNYLFVYYYGKARQYKEQLEQYMSWNNFLNSLYKRYSSAAENAMADSQLKGTGKIWKNSGYRKPSSIAIPMIEKIKPMILPIIFLFKRVYHNQPRHRRTIITSSTCRC